MTTEKPILYSGGISLDVATLRAFHQQQAIKLSDLSFRVLMTLVKSYPETVSQQQLIDQVWNHVAVSPETVTQRVAMIRKALSDVGVDPEQYIASARNVGYRWLCPVEEKTKQHSPARWVMPLVVVVLLGIGYLVKQGNKQKHSRPVTAETPRVSTNDLTNQAWHYLDKHTAQSNRLAVGLFREALALNPHNPQALTGLSIALSHQASKFNQSHEVLIEARQLAKQAITLDADMALAWAALAFVDDANGDIDQAIVGYEKAIQLDPNNTSTISSLAYLFGKKGRLVEAVRMCVSVLGSEQYYLDLQIAHLMELLGYDALANQWYRKADLLSPDNVFATAARAQYYLIKEDYSMAQDLLQQAMDRGVERPELPTLLGLIAWKQNNIKQAISHFQAAQAIDSNDSESLWMLQALQPQGEPLPQWMADELHKNHGWPDEWVRQAQFLAHTGHHQAAIEHLNAAYIAGYRYSRWLEWVPAFDALKSLPDWHALIQRINTDVDNQRQQINHAEWLPTSFLNSENQSLRFK